ncbi:cell wall assembly regulator SMI1 [Hymenobacter luteus]|uniref:Cell wall assembly regulator SMI1 n=2 Tax=Hymenobacter TaxID=89966 RepID=A0A7W9T162_9BACT|nr:MULTISPECIES: SMI1/KNR4 family protein [Hymenobacter]MBB4601859.1 cell wall assembly regulator SMI1 [Hymenobacter latericoloratus]MBB6059712.1 cell wall assembly regulator SMI1 [Hymenobacter luteus]
MSSSDSIRRIETWLSAHAPRILTESLNPGATESELSGLEAAVGKPLPEDYKALYRWRNGLDEDADNFGSLFYSLSFIPLAGVATAFQSRAQDPELCPPVYAQASVKADNVLNPYWLQLGFDGSHTWLCVDLDPTPAGRYGQIIFVDEENESVFQVAESVEALLAQFAEDLEQGRYILDPDALADGNEFLAAAESIDVVNWHHAPRWQGVLPASAYN